MTPLQKLPRLPAKANVLDAKYTAAQMRAYAIKAIQRELQAGGFISVVNESLTTEPRVMGVGDELTGAAFYCDEVDSKGVKP